MAIRAVNPANGKIMKTYPEMSYAQVETILQKSHKAFEKWRTTTIAQRAGLMKKAEDILMSRKEEYARLMSEEMGKPIKQGRLEIEKCARGCDYYIQHAAEFLKDEVVDTEAQRSFVTYQPIGVVLAVMPWNFPFWQVFRFATPTLMAGNAGILKHASNVPGCALAIEKVFKDAGFPADLFRTLLIGSPKVARVIENPLVKAVTLTGSTPAGKAIASQAGAVIKKTVLELGGSDPYIILEDADIEKAVSICVESRLINGGQSCISAKRFIVPKSIVTRVEKLFVERMQVKMGEPLDEETALGPQARHDLRDQLHQQVLKSLKKGAKLLLGGAIPKSAGAYYPPTVLTNVKKGMPAYDEELFGPVAAIIAARDEAEAIAIANDSEFGLGAAVFTTDLVRGEDIAKHKIESGSCFVNELVRSDPRLPFGGVKESGYGRELSAFGIREFVNIKSVSIA